MLQVGEVLWVTTNNINHIATLAESLLPRGSERPELSSKLELQKFVEDSGVDTPGLTLLQVCDLTFHAGAYEHSCG